MLPQIMSKYLSLTFYAFEMSVRFSVVLGIIGVVGIGTLFKRYQDEIY
jgi:ABC-type phosphate/phosphonate transport system permease subunit